MLEIRLLGQYEIHLNAEPLEVSSRPARLLFAYLVITRGTTHPRERLAGLLWPDSSDQNARKNLRQTLWHLRKAIGEPYLDIDSKSIGFNSSSDYWLDIALLEDKSEQDLEVAVSVYEGELLPGYYEDWILLERDRLAATFERMMQRLLKQLIREKRWIDILEKAEWWIAQGLAPESAFRALLRAHAELGELSNVEAAYRRCVQTLQQDLGVDPSEETEQLYQALLAGEMASPVGNSEKIQEISTAETSLVNLPVQLTTFVGRMSELAEIKEIILNTRLLSITGPGGIGKTRLAIQAASEIAQEFMHGCIFVSFAPIRAVDHVIQAIAEALNFPHATHEDPKIQLFRHLKRRQLLLVMDNLEHLPDAVEILGEILQAAPEVKILVTSREKLNLKGETNLVIAGMDFPEFEDTDAVDSYDAVSLFIQSARRARPDFSPDLLELKHISSICQIVGGMPLAIELAAAWLYVLKVEEIAAELNIGFDILETDKRDAPERHRSIRAVFDQSWSLLDQAEQDIFSKLSVFRGGFTREAAERVTGATLHQLAGLANKSFMTRNPTTGRFELHELLRQFADEQLEKTKGAKFSLLEKFAAYYANFMEERAVQLRDIRQENAKDEIVDDIENVRAAWRFYLEQRDTSMMWKFITGLWQVYYFRWWTHAGMELFEEAVSALEEMKDAESTSLRGLAMAFQSYFMGWVGLPDEGYDLAEKSVEILSQFDLPEALVFAYESVALNAYFNGRMSEEREAIDKMVEITNELDDKWLKAFTQFAAGMINLIEGNYLEARRISETNLRLFQDIGDKTYSTMPLIVLGHVALAHGEYDDARDYYQRCLAKAEDVNFYYSIQTASKYLGKLLISTGNLEEAEFYLSKSLLITRDIGWVRDIINLIYEFARLRVEQRRVEQAVELLTMVIQHPSSDQIRWLEGSIRESAETLLAKLEVEISPEIIASGTERGLSLELDEVVSTLLVTDPM